MSFSNFHVLVDWEVLKWFGHVKRMSGEWTTKRLSRMWRIEELRAICRSSTRWLDGMKMACNEMLLELKDAKVKCMDS